MRRRESLRGDQPLFRRGAMSGDREQHLREALYCERILGKSGRGVVTALLDDAPPTVMTHYPTGDAYDPDSGAQFYYHSHPPDASGEEHGHFHCFLRPESASGPIHHLIALGMDRDGKLARLFTVNRWVTGDDWRDAETLIALLPRFDLQLATPDYLVNRWLTAVVALHRDSIADLLHARDAALTGKPAEALEDRALEVLSEKPARLAAA